MFGNVLHLGQKCSALSAVWEIPSIAGAAYRTPVWWPHSDMCGLVGDLLSVWLSSSCVMGMGPLGPSLALGLGVGVVPPHPRKLWVGFPWLFWCLPWQLGGGHGGNDCMGC